MRSVPPCGVCRVGCFLASCRCGNPHLTPFMPTSLSAQSRKEQEEKDAAQEQDAQEHERLPGSLSDCVDDDEARCRRPGRVRRTSLDLAFLQVVGGRGFKMTSIPPRRGLVRGACLVLVPTFAHGGGWRLPGRLQLLGPLLRPFGDARFLDLEGV